MKDSQDINMTRFQLILPVDSQKVTKNRTEWTNGTWSPSIEAHVLFGSKQSDQKYRVFQKMLHNDMVLIAAPAALL